MLTKIRVLILVLLSLLRAFAKTDMKRVVGDNATLPCYHKLWQANPATIDIEWLLVKPNFKQTVVITYFAGQVFDPNEHEVSRTSFVADYLRGDASLLISDLSLSDTGEYTCKVKNGGKYHWSTVNLLVLVKPSKPQCWTEGQILEGNDVTMSCKSTEGSDPIRYNWERVVDEEKYVGKLPSSAKKDLKTPEILTLRNVTKDSAGWYKCTASNDAGEESCIVEVKLHYVRGIGVLAGALVGVSFGLLLIFLIVWTVLCTKEKKYEEEETPNEIREDAEAPKVKLVKPNSLSSFHSGSTHSGTSSTQSIVHHSGLVSPLLVVEQAANFPQHPPGYGQVVLRIPEYGTPQPSSPTMYSANLVRMGGMPVMIPAQTQAVQTA